VSDGRQDNFFKTNEEREMNEVKLTPVAFVKNDREDASDFEWGRVESEIVFEPGYADGLLGLEQFSHAIVVFHFNRALDEAPTLRRRPRGRDDMPMTGVFAQRGANRPNRLGVTAVEIVRVAANHVTVRGLDAVNGTPVLDLKPYVPTFDRIESARTPEWVGRLLRGYFGTERDPG
jgi:tRNA-Thr(GGU) m(6)t(6)A37 methyltransferase TsaA